MYGFTSAISSMTPNMNSEDSWNSVSVSNTTAYLNTCSRSQSLIDYNSTLTSEL